MEEYGQGGWVAEDNHGRKSMQPWDFNDRADRRLAKQLIDDDNSDWVVGFLRVLLSAFGTAR